MEYGLEKVAKKKKEPGYWDKQRGVVRASTDSEGKKGKKKGSSYIGIANKQLIKDRFKGSAKGAGYGAGIGGLAGLAASVLSKGKIKPGMASAAGAAGGAYVGSGVGSYKADQKYLKKKGITSEWGGLSNKFTAKAKKKYITDYEKKASVIGLDKLAGIAEIGAKAIKGPKLKVNEVMDVTPKNKRDDVLKELRKKASANDSDEASLGQMVGGFAGLGAGHQAVSKLLHEHTFSTSPLRGKSLVRSLGKEGLKGGLAGAGLGAALYGLAKLLEDDT